MSISHLDIEAIRRGAKDRGRPVKSNTIIDKDGTKIHYKVSKKDKVEIIGKDT
jgi:hypothetical protein